ncbi:hypothetical protein FOZ63_015866 [Perkinsus olseni]|uniref:Uncharacterized protein n=1 Tax=Perkinsus olseni TaxID=32597 RepID=A0A7J6R576_PEROL|nr:hypothetical protein FOZ63_015866 [Perkinsus olseni]
MQKTSASSLKTVAAVMPGRMRIVAIRRLLETFGPEHSEWPFWLQGIAEDSELNRNVSMMAPGVAAEALSSLYRIRNHHPTAADTIMQGLSERCIQEGHGAQHVVALIEAWGSTDTPVWDAKALDCLQRNSDTVLDPSTSDMTTFQLITLCDCLARMAQRGLKVESSTISKLAKFVRTNIREFTDTQQFPVLTHAFAVMLSSAEGAKKEEEVTKMLAVVCETVQTVWLREFSLNELSALLTTLHQCEAPARDLARAAVPEFVRLLDDDSQEVTGLILGSISLPLLKLTGRVEEDVVAALARRLSRTPPTLRLSPRSVSNILAGACGDRHADVKASRELLEDLAGRIDPEQPFAAIDSFSILRACGSILKPGQPASERTNNMITQCCDHLRQNYSDYEPRTLVFSLHMLSLFQPDRGLLRELLPVTDGFPLNLQTMLLGVCERGKDIDSARQVLDRIGRLRCSDSAEAARILRSISRLPSELWESYSNLVDDLSKCALKDTKSSSRIFAVCLALAKMKPKREKVSELLERVMRAVVAAGDRLDLVDAATATSILVKLTSGVEADGDDRSPIMLPSRFCEPVAESIVSCLLRASSASRFTARDLDRSSQCLAGLARLQLRPAETEALELCLANMINDSISTKAAPFILSIIHSMWKLDLRRASNSVTEKVVAALCEVDAVRTVYCAACLGASSVLGSFRSALRPGLTAVESSQLITALATIHLDHPRIGDTLSHDDLQTALDLLSTASRRQHGRVSRHEELRNEVCELLETLATPCIVDPKLFWT